MRAWPIALTAVVALAIGVPTAGPAAAAAPSAPVISNLAVASGQITVTYTPSVGATDHLYSVNGGAQVSAGTTGTIAIGGLANGQVACVTVVATNADGQSAPSNTWCGVPNNPSTPGTAQPVITGVTATTSALSVSYTRPDDGFAIDVYQVWLNGQFYDSIEDFKSPMTIPGLTAGNTYEIQIKAQGPAGAPDSTKSTTYRAATESAPAAPSIGAPEPPGVTITGSTRGSVSFTLVPPANDGGQAPTGYRYTINGVTTEVPTSSLSHTVRGLTSGVTYTVTANAANSAGWSAPGVANATTKSGPLSAPTNIRVTPGIRDAVVAWDPPADVTANELVKYYATVGGGSTGYCFDLEAKGSCRLALLTPDTAYTVRVTAFNASGGGAEGSAPFRTLPAPPENPTNFTVVPNAGERRSVRTSWTPPAPAGRNLTYSVSVERLDKGGRFVVCAGMSSTCIFNGVMPNAPYRYTLRMFDNRRQVFEVTEDFTLATSMPRMPRAPKAVQVGDRMQITWSEPVNADRFPPYGYEVRMFADNLRDDIGHLYDEWMCKAPPQTRSCTTRPLTPGLHYRFDVFALDDDGFRTDPAATGLVFMKDDPVPPITLAHAGNGSATVTVVDRASSSTRSADSFRVLRVDDWFGLVTSPACTIDVRTSTTCTVTGLENGTGYRFIAYAVNAAGESAAGFPSQVVEPGPSSPVTQAPSGVFNISATTRIANDMPATGNFRGVKAGTPFAKLSLGLDYRDTVWLQSDFSWRPPASTGGARDVVYQVSVIRWLAGMVGSQILSTNTCTTRELNCAVRFPYDIGSALDDVLQYRVEVSVMNSAGERFTLRQFNRDGTLRELSSAS